MRHLTRLVVALAVTLSCTSAFAVCRGISPPGVGPMVYANYNNFFPVRILGVQVSPAGAKNPPSITRSPVCLCPSSLLGIPLPGIMVTYWSPSYVYEAEDDPGCFPTISSATILPGFEGQRGAGSMSDENVRFKRQGHFFQYPLFNFFETFSSLACKDANSVVDLAYVTEIDPLWHNDLWSSVLNPEALLFNNPIAALACIPDAIASNVAYPIDQIFWCSSGKNLYPMASGVDRANSNEAGNMINITKFLMRHHRVGSLWQTVGPSAVCASHPNPIMPKSQYRIDPISPFPKGWGRPIVIGTHPLFWGSIANIPTQEGSVFLIWKAVQCCVRP